MVVVGEQGGEKIFAGQKNHFSSFQLFENWFNLLQACSVVKVFFCFVTVPRTSLAGLQSTVTALSCTNYKTEELD